MFEKPSYMVKLDWVAQGSLEGFNFSSLSTPPSPVLASVKKLVSYAAKFSAHSVNTTRLYAFTSVPHNQVWPCDQLLAKKRAKLMHLLPCVTHAGFPCFLLSLAGREKHHSLRSHVYKIESLGWHQLKESQLPMKSTQEKKLQYLSYCITSLP